MHKKYYVYVLKSLKDSRRYIGYTENFERRITEHNNGLVKSTRNRRPFEFIYFEEFDNKTEALIREKFFKSGKGRKYLSTIKT